MIVNTSSVEVPELLVLEKLLEPSGNVHVIIQFFLVNNSDIRHHFDLSPRMFKIEELISFRVGL